MKLIGMLDSPYVRGVAISLKCREIPFEHQQIPFEHQPLSVFRNFEEFSQINPLVKAPTLICDDGEKLNKLSARAAKLPEFVSTPLD